MPKIINRRKVKNYVQVERALIRDKRINPTAKLIYAVFCSLSETCENVFPSYKWLAEEIGYDSEGKTESAAKMYISRNMKELIDLGLIKIKNNPGGVSDYEIFDYNEDNVEPSRIRYTPSRRCDTTRNANVTVDKRREIKELEEENFSKKRESENQSPPENYEQSELTNEDIQKAKKFFSGKASKTESGKKILEALEKIESKEANEEQEEQVRTALSGILPRAKKAPDKKDPPDLNSLASILKNKT